MSDFLSNLVDRTLGRGSILQRRRPSRFEPKPVGPVVTPFTHSATKEMQEESAIVEAPAAEAKVEKSVLKRTRQIKQAVQSEHHEIVESAPDQKGVVSKKSAPRVVHRELETEPQPLQKSKNRKESPREAEPMIEKSLTQAPALSPAVRRAASDSTHLEKAHAPAAPLASRDSVGPLKPGQTLQKPVSVVRVTKEIEVQHKSQRPVRPAAPPMIRQAARQHLPVPAPAPDKSPAPPAIQVTIGRVEIRANQSATTPRGNVRSAPKVTLDDYLRMRNGGGR